MKTIVGLNSECVKRLKKDGRELVKLPDGNEIEFRWSDAKQLPAIIQEGGITQNRVGDGCCVYIEAQKP